ncbi:MAG: hypothetical protein UU01_C0033G0006 [Parcubacteria group bacterium GW2011_GWA2_40_37]|nr:MAG: hypothetical protein UU01_C0033G0006 [Parcubacteria group bacterium GW2011_GWA2_40_37]
MFVLKLISYPSKRSVRVLKYRLGAHQLLDCFPVAARINTLRIREETQ